MSTKLHQEYWDSVQNADLLDENAKKLEKARDDALIIADNKTVFLATMSHELRTPMNGILGMAQLLKLGELDKEQNEYVSTIQTSTNLLLTIINDILDHSKMESGKLTIEHHHFSLKVLLNNVHDLLKPVADEKGLDLNINITSTCTLDFIGDEGKIRQILLNLLGNAIKFTKTGSISIDIECLNDDKENNIRFNITDTGIGIDDDKQSVVFSDFTQEDNSTTREYGGTGLGLTISKQLVELLGGNIGLKSEKGVGSTFWFEIPLTMAGTSSDNEKVNNISSSQQNPDFILDPKIQESLKETMEDQYSLLIKSHITSTKETIINIQECVESKNKEKLHTYLNSLKSSSSSIGAKALVAEINFIEKNLLDNILPSDNEIKNLHNVFDELVKALLKQIK